MLDPYSALDLTYENKYDIYLFDVNLPYESGFDLLGKLRAGGDMTPTIFITSRDDNVITSYSIHYTKLYDFILLTASRSFSSKSFCSSTELL